MPIVPVRYGDRAGPMPSKKRGSRSDELWVLRQTSIGPAKILAPAHAKQLRRIVGFAPPFIGRAIRAELAGAEIAQAHAVTLGDMLRDRCAHANLAVIGMGAEHDQIDRLGHTD
jgi:hypothetical protein